MTIYIIRHGESEKTSSTGKDSARHLTTEGKEIIRNAAQYWKEIIPFINCIFSSPFIRAVETAEIIREVFALDGEIIKDDRFAPGSNTLDIINAVLECGKDSIAIVGHQPDCSEHISQLVSNSGLSLNFSAASIAAIEFSGKIRMSAGTLQFLIPSKIFKTKNQAD